MCQKLNFKAVTPIICVLSFPAAVRTKEASAGGICSQACVSHTSGVPLRRTHVPAPQTDSHIYAIIDQDLTGITRNGEKASSLKQQPLQKKAVVGSMMQKATCYG
ncbi:hypothetical protein [Pontibacter beigongshangensis]|uniref:hypothetical protein n=1 Tax=Pontibacter beigongshangensis TaxID=2574733 RepID=UPI00164F54F6|nr:hypothetical protein [Pontibacter beigongshangensis]